MAVQSERVRLPAPLVRQSAAVRHPRSEATASSPFPRFDTPRPPVISPLSRTARALWRWADGLAMLVIFVTATLVMVLAVVMVDAVDRWWVLMPVMALDLTMTFFVIAAITHLLGDDGESLR